MCKSSWLGEIIFETLLGFPAGERTTLILSSTKLTGPRMHGCDSSFLDLLRPTGVATHAWLPPQTFSSWLIRYCWQAAAFDSAPVICNAAEALNGPTRLECITVRKEGALGLHHACRVLMTQPQHCRACADVPQSVESQSAPACWQKLTEWQLV